MKRLCCYLFWGLIIACPTADAMDQQLRSQAEQYTNNARWDDLVDLIDTHPAITGDQWLHFLTPRATALEKKDDASYTFCSRLLFSACKGASGDQSSKKAVLEHLLSDLLGSNAQLNLTKTVSDEQIRNLDLGREAKPHRKLFDRLVNRRWFKKLPISGPLIGFVGVVAAAGVCVLAYFGYGHWKNQDVSASDDVNITEQTDELRAAKDPIASVS